MRPVPGGGLNKLHLGNEIKLCCRHCRRNTVNWSRARRTRQWRPTTSGCCSCSPSALTLPSSLTASGGTSSRTTWWEIVSAQELSQLWLLKSSWTSVPSTTSTLASTSSWTWFWLCILSNNLFNEMYILVVCSALIVLGSKAHQLSFSKPSLQLALSSSLDLALRPIKRKKTQKWDKQEKRNHQCSKLCSYFSFLLHDSRACVQQGNPLSMLTNSS